MLPSQDNIFEPSCYLLSCSGGKDSVASALLAWLHNEPLTTILFSEVMYDNTRCISGEDPEHVDFVKNVLKPFFESRGYEFVILHAESDYLTFFHHIIRCRDQNSPNHGKVHGFPLTTRCGIQRDLKVKPVARYIAENVQGNYVHYLGYAADEPKRLARLGKVGRAYRVSLLDKYGLTEKDAYELCEKYGLLSPLYRLSRRGGCIFCPNSKLSENIEWQRKHPELWAELVSLEKERDLAYPKWSLYGDSLQERDRRIRELEGI